MYVRYVTARLACVFGAAVLAEIAASAAEMETKVILKEDYEKYAPGDVPKGVLGADRQKGAVIEVVGPRRRGESKSLKYVDVPDMPKTFYPFRELRFRGRKLADSGTVLLRCRVCLDPEMPARFDLEMRDWTKGAYKNLPKLSFNADGSVLANGKSVPFRLQPGEWTDVAIKFPIGEDVEKKVYRLRMAAGERKLDDFEATYAKDAQRLTWLGFIPYNETKAAFYIDNVYLAVRREKIPVEPHDLYTDYIIRTGLARSNARFTAGGPVRVAFMGGSVTTRQWRGPVMDFLEERYPQATFDFIMAGIGGTNADLGAFRFPDHVFSKGKVDLFFLEFAVNGGGVRAMEGIVRQARRLNPDIDIVIMYFASTGHTKSFEDGKIPGIVQTHEKVAEHYGIPVLYLYREIAQRIKDGKIKWEDFAGDSVHPHQGGCDMYSQCITDFLDAELKGSKPGPRTEPEPLDPLCYENGRFISLEAANIVKGFERIPKWTCKKTCNFAPPVDVLACTEPGSELNLAFTGTAMGIYTIIGMDAGIIEYSIDDGEFKTADQFDHYCPKFHRPQHKIFASDLKPGTHTITLRSSAKKNAKSEGHAIRILKFMAN